MKKKLVMTFYDEKGEVVSQLSKDPANYDQVLSAIQFLNAGCEINIACREFDIEAAIK